MPALNTTQGHHRVDTSNVVYLHRGHTHELHEHCKPQERDTLDSFDRGFVALSCIVSLAVVAWIAAGMPGLAYIGG